MFLNVLDLSHIRPENNERMNPLDAPLAPEDAIDAPLWPTIRKFGFIGGGLIIFINFFTFWITSSSSITYSYLINIGISFFLVIFYIVVMILAVREYRYKHNHNFLHFGKGLLVGWGTAMLIGTIGLIFSLFYVFVLDPEYYSRMWEHQYLEFEIDPAVTHRPSQEQTSFMAISQVGSYFLGALTGFIISLFISLGFKRDRPVWR